MGGTGCGEIWVLLWWARPCSVNLESNFLLMGGVVFPHCSVAWGQTMVRLMAIITTSFTMTYASMLWLPGLFYAVSLTPQQATVDPCLPWELLDPHRQVWLSLLWRHRPFLLGPGGTRFCLCPPRVFFPQLWKFCNQIPLAFKVKFPRSS